MDWDTELWKLYLYLAKKNSGIVVVPRVCLERIIGRYEYESAILVYDEEKGFERILVVYKPSLSDNPKSD